MQSPYLEDKPPSSWANSKLSWERSGLGSRGGLLRATGGGPHPMFFPPCTFFKTPRHLVMTQVAALSLGPQAK